MTIDLTSEISPERQYLEQHYPELLDMAAQMILAGCTIVEKTGKSAQATGAFERNADGSFQFTYYVHQQLWHHGENCPHTCCN